MGERLKTYEAKTEPVIDYFKTHNLLVNFKGRFSNEIWPKVHKELSNFKEPSQYTEYN